MSREPVARGRQKVTAGRDANVAGRDLIIVNVAAAGRTGLGVPGLLPRDVPGFAGREGELARIVALAQRGSMVVIAIGGTAGVGKTAMAVHAAHRLLPKFPDGHLYADLRGYTEGQDPDAPGEVLQVFLRHLGVPAEEIPLTVEQRSGALRQMLGSRRVLMILDNARTEAQVRPLLPGAGESLVLVTSQSVLPGLEVNERISLDVLSGDEAAGMLTGLVGIARATAEPEAVAEVARLCGRLPLALRIAGQLLAVHSIWPVAQLAGMLADEQNRLARLGAGDLQVRAAFEVSYRLLAEEDARMFRLLGLHPGPDFTTAAAAALTGTEPGAGGASLDRLMLVSMIIEDAAGRFGMHDLLRLFARQTCQETDDQATRDAAETRLVSHYSALAKFLDECLSPQPGEAVKEGASLLGPLQALTVFETERLSLLAALGLAAERGWDEQVERLGDNMGERLEFLRYLDDLVTVQETALAAARRAGDTAAVGRALGNFGVAYRELRRFEEAIGCYQESLAIFREAGDRRREGQALNNLGIVYQDLQQFEEAISYHQDALAILREAGDRPNKGQALNNLGNANWELQRFEDAIGYYQESLATFREIGDRPNEGQVLGNLGNANWELRRFEDAIGCYQESLAIRRNIGDRHGEGYVLNNLGAAYWDLRRFEEAIGSFQDSLAATRETGDRYVEGNTLNNLGDCYKELRQPDQAAEYWREAAKALRDAGDYKKAARLERLAAKARSRRRRWLRNG